MPRLDISLASVDLVVGAPPALRVIHPGESSSAGGAAGWASVVAAAEEPCLLLDADGLIQAVSPAFLTLFGLGSAGSVLGRGLLDDLLDLVDFSARGAGLTAAELERIPPVQSLRSGGLARGLVRVRVGGAVRTVDAVTTPLRVGDQVGGSLTFFAAV